MTEPTSVFSPDVFARGCTSRETVQNVTGRWGFLVLAALLDESYRFSALRRRIDGVSERMLSQTLHTLERDGMITRTVLEQIPPKVEYALTPLGRDVAERVTGLIDVIESNMPTVTAARESYDAR
jgi:DNA-binding HxlR family transcriptional regulator